MQGSRRIKYAIDGATLYVGAQPAMYAALASITWGGAEIAVSGAARGSAAEAWFCLLPAPATVDRDAGMPVAGQLPAGLLSCPDAEEPRAGMCGMLRRVVLVPIELGGGRGESRTLRLSPEEMSGPDAGGRRVSNSPEMGCGIR